jgi:hypothetical protein
MAGQECLVLIAQRRFTISVRGTNCAAPGGRRISCQRAREKLARIGLNVAVEVRSDPGAPRESVIGVDPSTDFFGRGILRRLLSHA